MNNPATLSGGLTALVIAVMAVLSAFGFKLTEEQRSSILFLLAALIGLGTYFVHQTTTSKSSAQGKIDEAWKTDPASDPTAEKPTA